ncbi:hypothetical protein [Galbibacter sp.]|uniref:hypothetical protein n=1 Tax=Galbibacter sp. TaxID=2918471 RepID=UPI003A91827F
MKRTILNISTSFKQYFLVLTAILFVLLSSCAIKSSIKELTGISANTEQGVPQNSRNLFTNSVEKCPSFDISDSQVVQNISSHSDDLLPLISFKTAFLFLFDFPSLESESIHPLYNGSRKIQSSIPIFLEYQKLIIHYSC